MKAKDVEIGATYKVKVGRNLAEVKIVGENPHGGWDGKSASTGKAIRIKSPQRLRSRVKTRSEQAAEIADGIMEDQKAERKETFTVTTDDGHEIKVTYDKEFRDHLEFRGPISETGYRSHFGYDGSGDVKQAAALIANGLREDFLAKEKKQKRRKKSGNDAPAPRERCQRRGLSLLDAAARVLQEEAGPLTSAEIVDLCETKGLWSSPGGKTPQNTLYSAIIREIAKKKEASRFVKAERGKFAFQS